MRLLRDNTNKILKNIVFYYQIVLQNQGRSDHRWDQRQNGNYQFFSTLQIQHFQLLAYFRPI